MKITMLFPVIFTFLVFSSCTENPKPAHEITPTSMSAEEKEEFVKKGKSITLATFATLSSELGKALEEGVVTKAVEICNISAMPLVDSLSKSHHATIRRTSLRIRNPKNKATAEELKVLEGYQEDVNTGKTLEPKVEEVNGMVSFYSPIMVQPLCLSCHGKVGETLKETDYSLIKNLYPQDQAIDYKSGELRGMWSIQFEK